MSVGRTHEARGHRASAAPRAAAGSLLAAAALSLAVGPARAQDAAAVRSCAAEAAAVAECVGRLAQACTEASPDGETTAGMVRCIADETAAWDAMLNEEYRATMAEARALDAAGDGAFAPI